MNNVNVVFPFLFQNDTTIECQYTEFNINTTGAYLLFLDKNVGYGGFAQNRCFLVEKTTFNYVGPFLTFSNPFWCIKRVNRDKSKNWLKLLHVEVLSEIGLKLLRRSQYRGEVLSYHLCTQAKGQYLKIKRVCLQVLRIVHLRANDFLDW